VDALQLDLQDMQKVVAEKEKRMRRQREIWTDKAAEFRDVIASVLGWKITFLPNGKAKVSSMFHGKGDVDEEDEQSIIFDGEKGTMKISGGAEGAFAREIKQQVDFWVKEKKEIPCFLAALTIQFHDEYRSG
jgi:mitotic spindle assembly checkpoint protein MAD1